MTQKMIDAGKQMAADLITARIASSMGGLGGCMEWEEWQQQPHENKDLILLCLADQIDDVEAIYVAMERANK